MLNVNFNDYPNLKNRIFEAFVDRETLKSIEAYRKDNDAHGGIYATKNLLGKLNDIVVEESGDRRISYESVTSYAPTFLSSIKEQREKEKDETIKCYIKEIDETLSVGFTPGSLVLFCGDVGGYKSTMMMNVAVNVWKLAKKNVLYIPLEMPRAMMYQKFISREKKIKFEHLQHPKLMSPLQVKQIENFGKEITQFEEENGCSFYIMDAPEQISVSVIRREIERNIDVFKPNLVVVDYIANLIPDQNTYRRDRNDLEIGNMLKSLRSMGNVGSIHDEGFGVVSGAQIGREGLKRYRKSGNKGVFYSEDIHGSHQYSADADAMYAQMKPQQSNDNTRIEFIVIKSRYGKPIFSNGSNKTMLEVEPEYSLIKSINTSFYNEKKGEILSKVNDSSELNFDDDDDETENSDNMNEINQLLFS